MARIRTIKPEFWADEDLSDLPIEAHMLAAALLNYADDEGFFNANPKLIKASCFPLRDLSMSVHECLEQLSKIGYLRIGEGSDGKQYGHICNFASHQRINRPSESKIAKQSITWHDSRKIHEQVNEGSYPEGNREQGTGNEEQGGESAGAPEEPANTDPPDPPKKSNDPPCPPNVSESVWAAYVDHRKAKNAKLTEHAVKLLTKKLAELSQAQADRCLELSIENGWTGVFPEQVQRTTGGGRGAAGQRDYSKGIAADGSF